MLLLWTVEASWGQQAIETLPPLRVTAQLPAPLQQLPPKVVPITLDTVLHWPKITMARSASPVLALEEASIKGVIANQRRLPNILVGPSFYRHEGGIQDFQGNLVHSSYGSLFGGVEVRGKVDWKELTFRKVEAERQVIQRSSELVKLTSEQLLDAAGPTSTSCRAHTAVAVSAASEKQLADIVDQARRLADLDPGLRVEVVRHRIGTGRPARAHRSLQERTQSCACG